jgi:aspartate ammonia-lyase
MPGKVNPVIPEVVNQVCFRAIGSDLTVTLAAEAGQLQLNVMEPVIAVCILETQTILRNALRTLRVFCVNGITANEDVCRAFVEKSIGIVTALNPVLGYEIATKLAAEALHSGRGVVEIVRERKLLSEDEIQRILDPASMTGLRKQK